MVAESAAQDASLRRNVRPHPHGSEPVVSLITWRPQAWERRKSLRVDDHSQRSSCFHAGTSVARDNRRATSVQPHFFDSGSAAAAGGQERAGQTLFARLATGGRKVEKFDSNGCAYGAREAGRRRRCVAIVRRSAPRRRRARETARRRRKHRGGDVRVRQRAGSGSAQSAHLVWRRR